MPGIGTLIDFLLKLMRDDDAKTAFEQNPQGTLSKHGLEGVTGEDIRDARLIMADRGDVKSTSHDWSGPRHADPVREIHHTTRHFEVRDQTINVVQIDDRDTVINNNDIDVIAIDDKDTVTVIDDKDTINVNDPGEDPGDPAKDPEPVEDEVGVIQDPIPGEPQVVIDDPAVSGPAEEPPAEEPSEEEPVEEPAAIEDPVEEEPELDPADAAIV